MVYSPSGDSLWVATGGTPGAAGARAQAHKKHQKARDRESLPQKSLEWVEDYTVLYSGLLQQPEFCLRGKLQIFPSNSLQTPERSARASRSRRL